MVMVIFRNRVEAGGGWAPRWRPCGVPARSCSVCRVAVGCRSRSRWRARWTRRSTWLRHQPAAPGLPAGLFGASTGAAAALRTAAVPAARVAAVVSRVR
jgi:hypothetical protein